MCAESCGTVEPIPLAGVSIFVVLAPFFVVVAAVVDDPARGGPDDRYAPGIRVDCAPKVLPAGCGVVWLRCHVGCSGDCIECDATICGIEILGEHQHLVGGAKPPSTVLTLEASAL